MIVPQNENRILLRMFHDNNSNLREPVIFNC